MALKDVSPKYRKRKDALNSIRIPSNETSDATVTLSSTASIKLQ